MGEHSSNLALVVEDDWLLRTEIVEKLQAAGFFVLGASTGQRALELIEQGYQFHLLIADINLGGPLDGWDLAEALRVWEEDIPVIYVSGDPADAGRRVPGSVVMDKPVMLSELVRLSNNLVGNAA
jgi:CheY-like chemotaxis protein